MSDTFEVLADIAEAWELDIVVVFPAKAVEDEVPKAKLEVPAPINVLTSAAVTPEASCYLARC